MLSEGAPGHSLRLGGGEWAYGILVPYPSRIRSRGSWHGVPLNVADADGAVDSKDQSSRKLTNNPYQRTSTSPEAAIFESAVTSGASSAFAVAMMKRSHGSRSAFSGIVS